MSTRPDVGQGGHGGHGGQGGHGGAADGGAGGVAGTGGTADGGAGDVTTAATSGTVVTRMREIRRVSPWSALRMGFALSVCLFAVWFIAAVLVFIHRRSLPNGNSHTPDVVQRRRKSNAESPRSSSRS